MGRVNTPQERAETLARIKRADNHEHLALLSVRPSEIAALYYQELRDYFALCAMARGKTAIALEAELLLFRTRISLERRISRSIHDFVLSQPSSFDDLLDQKCFGASKKQGVSIRLPLTSCQPTKLCANLCYAHDVLDASPSSVIRGAVNGVIGEIFENSSESERHLILNGLKKHVAFAVKSSLREANSSQFARSARIRFGHIGEAAAYPAFVNRLAQLVREMSGGQVQPVVYSRHSQAKMLDPEQFVVNFTLDPSSESRRRNAPPFARIVYSAFGGVTSAQVSVNFLEHHRFIHLEAKGDGNVCPATEPKTINRTCDGVACDLCFRRP